MGGLDWVLVDWYGLCVEYEWVESEYELNLGKLNMNVFR